MFPSRFSFGRQCTWSECVHEVTAAHWPSWVPRRIASFFLQSEQQEGTSKELSSPCKPQSCKETDLVKVCQILGNQRVYAKSVESFKKSGNGGNAGTGKVTATRLAIVGRWKTECRWRCKPHRNLEKSTTAIAQLKVLEHRGYIGITANKMETIT